MSMRAMLLSGLWLTAMSLPLAQAAYAQEAAAPSSAPAVTNNVNLGQEQMQMLQAAQYVIQGKLAEAEIVYTSVIGLSPKNLQAHIQRSIIRRELNNTPGMEADAVEVLNISQMEMQQRPNDGTLYYSRGMAYRILRDYGKARADIEHALQLSPENASWKQDLQAMALEEKML